MTAGDNIRVAYEDSRDSSPLAGWVGAAHDGVAVHSVNTFARLTGKEFEFGRG